MKKRQKPKPHFEDQWLAKEVRKAFEKSGCQQRQFARELALPAAEATVSYLLNGKRGMSFYKGVRLATRVGIDLSKLQELLRR